MEQEEIERTADRICDMYDEVYFAAMNRILEQVRANNSHETTPSTLGQLALQEPESPRIP